MIDLVINAPNYTDASLFRFTCILEHSQHMFAVTYPFKRLRDVPAKEMSVGAGPDPF